MTKRELALVIAITFLVFVVVPITGFSWFRAGYKDGQLDAARGNLRWTIMEGVIVEFHGLDVQEAKE